MTVSPKAKPAPEELPRALQLSRARSLLHAGVPVLDETASTTADASESLRAASDAAWDPPSHADTNRTLLFSTLTDCAVPRCPRRRTAAGGWSGLCHMSSSGAVAAR